MGGDGETPIFFVGTHRDKVSKADALAKFDAIRRRFGSEFRKNIRDDQFYRVACPTRKGVKRLTVAMRNVALQRLVRPIPSRYLKLVHSLRSLSQLPVRSSAFSSFFLIFLTM